MTDRKPSQLSPAHQKLLGRLVRCYGPNLIAAAAMKIPVRGPGAPHKNYSEAMHLADCIEEWAAEHRERGSRSPYKMAYHDLFEVRFDKQDKRDFQKFEQTVKKEHYRGRRALIAYLKDELAKGRLRFERLPPHLQALLRTKGG